MSDHENGNVNENGHGNSGHDEEPAPQNSSGSSDSVLEAPFFQIPRPPLNVFRNGLNGYLNHNGPNYSYDESDSDRSSGISNATTAVVGELEHNCDSRNSSTLNSQEEIFSKNLIGSSSSNDSKLSSLSSFVISSQNSTDSRDRSLISENSSQNIQDEFILSQPNSISLPFNETITNPINNDTSSTLDFSNPMMIVESVEENEKNENEEMEKKYLDYYNIASYKGAFDKPPDNRLKCSSLLDFPSELLTEPCVVVSESSNDGSVDLKLSQTQPEDDVVPESDIEDGFMNVSSEGIDDTNKEVEGYIEKMECDQNRELSERRMELLKRNDDIFAPLRQPTLDFQRAMQDLPGPSGLSKISTVYDSDSEEDIGAKTEETKWKASTPAMKSTYVSVKGKGRGKRSKPVDSDEVKGPKIGRFTCDEIVEQQTNDTYISQQVIDSLCLEVEKSVEFKNAQPSTNQLIRSKSDIPVSCEFLVNAGSCSKCSDDEQCVRKDKEKTTVRRRPRNVSSCRELRERNQDLFSDVTNLGLYERAKSNDGMENKSKLKRKVTTTTYMKTVIQEEIIDGENVLQSILTEEDGDPVVVSSDEILDYEEYMKKYSKSSDDDINDDKKITQEGDSSNVTLTIESCDDDAKNMTIEHCLTLTDISANFKDICIGKRVMARWKDGFFYPGKVIGKNQIDKWIVKYDDGSVRAAMTTIFAIDILPVQLEIFAQIDKELDFENGLILAQEVCGENVKYLVELKSGDRRIIPHSAIALNYEQFLNFKIEDNFIEPGITLDNIVDGKRRHKEAKHLVYSPDLPHKIEIKEKKKSMTTINRKILHSTKMKNIKSRNSNKSISESIDANQKFSDETSQPKVQRNILFRPCKILDESSVDGDSTMLITLEHGPIPHVGSELFNGKTFVLTQGPNSNKEIPPLSKVHLKNQIAAGGGVVLTNLTDKEATANISEYFLISDSHCRTSKYITALAVPIPCVSHLWIINSCKQDKLLDYKDFLLPAGYSLMCDEVIEWHGKSKVFGGFCFAFASDENSNCVQLLSTVLTVGGGRVITDRNSYDSAEVHVIIADENVSSLVKEKLSLLSKPIVTKEWVFHCLIHGCKLQFTAHEKFSLSF